MEPSPLLEWLVPLLTCLGLALTGPLALRLLSGRIQTEVFGNYIVKLLRAGNYDRARKLTLAAGSAPCAVATRAALDAAHAGPPTSTEQPADYRTAGMELTRDRVLGRLHERYQRALTEALAPLRSRRWLGYFGALFVLGALPAAWLTENTPTSWAIAGGGLLVWILLARADRKLVADANGLFAQLAPTLYDFTISPAPLSTKTEPARIDNGATRLTLEVHEPGQAPRTVELCQLVVKLGSELDANVVLLGKGVARMHAVLECTEDEVSIIDLGSDAGTLVNGSRVNKQTLASGDRVQLGDVVLVVQLDS